MNTNDLLIILLSIIIIETSFLIGFAIWFYISHREDSDDEIAKLLEK